MILSTVNKISNKVFLIRNVSGDSYGGGEIYQLKLAEELREAGLEPIIVTNSRELLTQSRKKNFKTLKPPYIKNQNWSGWRNVMLPVYFLYISCLRRWYKKVFKYYRPRVINIQSRDDFLAATSVAHKFGIRVLWTDHADFCNWVLWNVNTKFKNLVGKKIIKTSSKAQEVIFVSKVVADETIKMIYPKTLNNTVVIENGVKDELVKYSGIKASNDSFVYVGRVTEEKGIRQLIEAFKKITAQHPKMVLNIYGDGEIEKYKKLSGKYNNICFYGKTDEPLMAIAENDVFILPSHKEGLSLSLLDAAMMGKKIIASDVGGNSEVIINKKTGLLVSAKNIEELADAMDWMLRHKEEANEMAKNVRLRYKKQFDFDKIFREKMLPLYNNTERRKK